MSDKNCDLKRLALCLVLAVAIGLIAVVSVGTLESDRDLLKQFIVASVPLLGFTGIILGVSHTAYASTLRELDSQSRGWFELGTREGASEEIKNKALEWQQELSRKTREVESEFGRSHNDLKAAASAFGILLVIELVHLRISSSALSCYHVTNTIAFGFEFFLLVFGLEMLLSSMFAGIKAAHWQVG